MKINLYNKFAMGPRNIKNITDKDNNLGLFVKMRKLSIQYKLLFNFRV